MTEPQELTPFDREFLRQAGFLERSKRIRAQTKGELVRSGMSPERADLLVENIYNVGWSEALLLFGRPDAEYVDGQPFFKTEL